MSVVNSGTVVDIQDDLAFVQVTPGKQCKGCSCGAGSRATRILRAKNMPNIHIGDRVVVEADTLSVLKAAFLLFFLPTLGIVAGIACTYLLSSDAGDLTYFSGAMIGAAFGFAALKLVARKILHIAAVVEKI